MEYETRFSATAIQSRLKELAQQINTDYPADSTLTVVGVLKGSFVFVADLIRLLEADITVGFIRVTSYGKAMVSNEAPKITKDLDIDISGQHVLLVEDIVDSGRTLEFLLKDFTTRSAASVKVCTLLKKNCNQKVDVPLDYVGFHFDSGFVLGYGLDHAEKYRQLKDIVVVKEE